MKNKTIKIIINLLLIILLASCNSSACKSGNTGLCELEKIKKLKIEESAKIKIGVFNEGFGNDLRESFALAYPKYKDLLEISVIDFNNSLDLSDFNDLDLIQLRSEVVPLYINNLLPLDDSFESLLHNPVLEKLAAQINQDKNYFLPFDSEGLIFAYNKTMLESFNVDLSDSNNDGLPDAIDSFEKIADLAKSWRKDQVKYLDEEINEIFSFPLNDRLAMLAFFENNDYRLIQGSSGEMIDLSSNLYKALDNLKTLGQDKWRFDESLENDLFWNYEEILKNQKAPFLLVGNWMHYDHYQKSKAYELVFSKLPQLNNKDLALLSSVSGFVINKNTSYPNAANMVLLHIKSPEGVQVTVNNGIIPTINKDLLKVEGFKISDNTKQQIKAYQYSEPAPLQAFEQKPEVRAWDIYLENNFNEIIKDVFLNKKEPVVAYSEIKKIIKDWLDLQGIVVEGVNND